MSYNTWPILADGDEWSETHHNLRFRDNFAVTPPGCFGAAGQMLVSTGVDAGAVIGAGQDGQILEYDPAASPKVKNSFGFVPIGGIVMWSGALGSLPANWQLCNGTNGTPDLRDRFVIGAGGTYAVGASGGANTVDLAHTHSIASGAAGSHTHTQGSTGAGSSHTHTQTSGAGVGTINTGNSPFTVGRVLPAHTHAWTTGAEAAHTHTNPNTDSGGSHQHAVSTNSQLTTQDMRPPYYALAYIMRLS